MQNIHQEILNNIDSKLIIKERLMGGMSNYTYLVTDGTNKFVFRVPGEGAANFVDNFIEEKNMEKILNPRPKPQQGDMFLTPTGCNYSRSIMLET